MIRTILSAVITSAFVLIALGCSREGGSQEEEIKMKAGQREGNPAEIAFRTIDGQPASLASYTGKVKLIVNTASQCGFTPQYAGLEDLYRKYQDRGLVVLGFPANNFGNQEPGTDEEIKQLCSTKFDVTFPMMSKVSVKGDDIHPMFAYLTEQSSLPGEIKWNFTKFLLDAENGLIARWPSNVEPTSDEIVSAIEKLLPRQM